MQSFYFEKKKKKVSRLTNCTEQTLTLLQFKCDIQFTTKNCKCNTPKNRRREAQTHTLFQSKVLIECILA